jgi:predicted membrane protein
VRKKEKKSLPEIKMNTVKILAVIGLIISIIWIIYDPGFEPLTVVIASLSTLVSSVFLDKHKNKELIQKQKVARSSLGMQAGKNINIENRVDKEDAE